MDERRNQRLRNAMKAAGLTYLALATRVGCNLKTAQRWCNEGRVPRRQRAQRVADVLGVSAEWLWPSFATEPGGADARSAIEISLQLSPETRIGADQGDDPPALWIRTDAAAVSIALRAIGDSRPLDRSDLEIASDIVMAAADFRTAIVTELTKTGVIMMPDRRPRNRRSLNGWPTSQANAGPSAVGREASRPAE